MPFEFEPLGIDGVTLIKPRVFEDRRGFFMETHRQSEFEASGMDAVFIQENHSLSSAGTLRGLHYQNSPMAQGKLIRVIRGEIFDVVVDLRKGATTYGRWISVRLSEKNKHILYVAPWFAHGFCVLGETAEVLYKTTAEYSPSHEAGIAWNDPALAIDWPLENPVLSDRDRKWPPLSEADNRFTYEGS
jgi:dTDP-4-dehydrorhamnose 3,5-epimerase